MSPSPALPSEFLSALTSLRAARYRSELKLAEVPAPARLAPFGVALGAEILCNNEELAKGRFILLHDPNGSDLWGGTFRVVTYIRAQLESEMGNDSLLGNVAWAWLVEALEEQGVTYTHVGGTATRILSESYGTLATRPDAIDLELRASWTPVGTSMKEHLEAWANILCTFAGVPPVPDGVTLLAPRQNRPDR
ncbi:DUF3000 domain-containing protein [Arthrobacter psychrochitiniphilus]|uniref:DUF3000 domain-containing protein n=1 Tax=Arthrobacter psychrochitiniphilus TaxID=291045 RepID=A0A2V3DY16_9MICC|nr:DUF3000 domain-containing protein [Arthrobacter psychrochitiniphilus]NYG17219.1 hypothetical protein [Arthrobacter psychrochitiniphilus]PXA65497.1 DUF3000 domain-containing protein [Arthrobacter psychrochitiniphilus]